MKKKYKLIINIFFIICLIYLFYKYVNTKILINNLSQINIIFLIISFFFIFFIPLFTAYRWRLICNEYLNISFKEFLFNMIKGYGLNSITSTSVALDVYKYTNIYKKIGKKKSFFLVIFDKVFSLYSKIFFLLIVFNTLNILEFKIYIVPILFSSLVAAIGLHIIFFYSHKIIKLNIFRFFFNEQNINFIKNFLIKFKKKYFIFILIVFISQIISVISYFFLFYAVIDKNILIYLFFLIPAVETLAQIQFFIGMREFITSITFTLFEIPVESSLIAASLYTFLFFLSTILQNILILFFKKNK